MDNIKMDLGETGWRDVDWSSVAQEKNPRSTFVNAIMNLRFP
jgi:hypothetical protein